MAKNKNVEKAAQALVDLVGETRDGAWWDSSLEGVAYGETAHLVFSYIGKTFDIEIKERKD